MKKQICSLSAFLKSVQESSFFVVNHEKNYYGSSWFFIKNPPQWISGALKKKFPESKVYGCLGLCFFDYNDLDSYSNKFEYFIQSHINSEMPPLFGQLTPYYRLREASRPTILRHPARILLDHAFKEVLLDSYIIEAFECESNAIRITDEFPDSNNTMRIITFSQKFSSNEAYLYVLPMKGEEQPYFKITPTGGLS